MVDLGALNDKLEIHELLARYARGVDDRDWDLYRDVFTPDAHIDYTSAGAIAGTRDEVVAFMQEVFPTIPWSQHYITNIEVDLDGDRAAVTACFHNPMIFPGTTELSSCGGRYHHQFVRTPDGWKSCDLREESLWFADPPAGLHR